ncbi:MAG: protein kinase [Myxococcota bacterium]
MSNRLAQQTGITTISDAQLIAAYRDREDASAYSELVRRHQIPVYRLLTGLLLDPDQAEPACEDVFVRAARRLDELSDPREIEAWLASLVHELAEERQDGSPQAEPRLPLDAPLAPAQGKAAMRGAVREVLAALPPEQRSVLILAELHGESVDRIARTLRESPRVIRERLAAARKGFVHALTQQRGHTIVQGAKRARADSEHEKTAEFTAADKLAPGYRIRTLLGAGGMGEVFLADQLATGRTVALKRLAPERTHDPALRERFHREAAAMAAVQHPNLVEVYEIGETKDGGLFMVMERLEGCELFAMLGGNRLPPPKALHILQHVLTALGELHAEGIVHRDVKPENVFVIEQPGDPCFAKVIDLGIARLPPELLQAHSNIRLTEAGMALGTPAYIAPEQACGGEVDGRADLYAATVMLYEMLAGRLPFKASDAGAMLAMHVSVMPPRLRTVAPGLDGLRHLEPLIERGLAKRPYDRFDDAAEFLAAVRKAAAAVK